MWLRRFTRRVSPVLVAVTVMSGMAVIGSAVAPPVASAQTAKPDGAYTPLIPARLFDSRPGQKTVDGIGAGSAILRPGTVSKIAVLGRGEYRPLGSAPSP
jgi:hypothetical protein